MSKSEEEIKNELMQMDENIVRAMGYLRNYEKDILNYIAEVVSSVCNVDKERMMSDDRTLPVTQSRWLFWYAYRYMTSYTYERISEETSRECTKQYTAVGVSVGTNKMSVMIEQEPIWKKRWGVVRRIIKLINDDDDTEREAHTITIQVPRELKGQITIKIQEV